MKREEIAGLQRIVEKRPEWQGRLQHAAKASATIAAMCGGYEIAGRGLDHWQAAEGPDRAAKLEDLQLLQTMLERLIQNDLELAAQHESWPTSPSVQKSPEASQGTPAPSGPASTDLTAARAAFDAIVERRPDARALLRQAFRVVIDSAERRRL
jgi:hypothetical protein